MKRSEMLLATFAVALALVLSVVLSNCGGDGSSTSASPPATSTTVTVTDTAAAPVEGAIVFAIPAADVDELATQPITLSNGNYTDNALKVDEPLEDLINGNFTPAGGGVATYESAVTDADGKAEFTSLPAGATDGFFIYVKPAETDTGHLPGGSLCREAVTGAWLAGKDTPVTVSTKPSASAEFVGSSSCLAACHADYADEKKTAHKLGLMAPGAPSGLQDISEFDADDGIYNTLAALDKYTTEGTTIWFYDYDPSRKFDKFKTLESDPGAEATVYATVRIYRDSDDSKHYAEFTNVVNTEDPNSGMTHEVVLTYGGGVYKQRPITAIDNSLFMVPLQFNATGDETSSDRTKKIWRDYHMDWWWNTADNTFKSKPAANVSVDVQCAPCHFNGYSVTTIDGYYQATGVADANGEIHPVTGEAQELNIGCETCHGPGSEHVAAGGNGVAIVTPRNLTTERESMICGQCHSRSQGNDNLGIHKDSPLDNTNKMMVAGTSRADFLANHTSRHDAASGDLWGDGLHSKAHHQQYTDFIQTKKYRNGSKLMTCASCHNPHGPGTDRHQLSGVSNNTLCTTCHTDVEIVAHQTEKTGATMGSSVKCVDCHNAKISTSGAGINPTDPFVGASDAEYYHGDISSHRFDVPTKADAVAAKMPVPYTNPCGLCHSGTGL